MDDDFHEPLSIPSSPPLTAKMWHLIFSAPLSVHITLLLAPILFALVTRFLSERPSRLEPGKGGRTVWMLPYWFPILGHGMAVLKYPMKLMAPARDRSHGIFALNLGATTHNIISDPGLVRSTMAQRQSAIEFYSIAWNVVERFHGLSNKPLYDKIWVELLHGSASLMKEPHLSEVLDPTTRYLEQNIPKMVTFLDTQIDLQQWERGSNHKYISQTEVEIDLFALVRDMLGHASVPALFGRGLLDKYPELLHDVFRMDEGMMFFLMGLPAWTPWPGVLRAHMARRNVWAALDDQQRALDKFTDGEDVDYSWGNLDDISSFIMKRHQLFKDNGFKVKERGDISILWALVINANVLVYWQLLYILTDASLLAKILEEITPHVIVSKPESIGRISEAPKLSISHDGLTKKCPLFKASYLEALRMSSQPWSIRRIATDISISTPEQEKYNLKKGEFITMPHELHMRDPKYFPHPEKFDPDRFIVHNEDGSISAEPGTTRPFGGGTSMCKGRVYAERECLALVAGILAFWEFEPVGGKGWVIPKMIKTAGVSRPDGETRVRIRRRRFEWEKTVF